jgi:neutral ceramidase
VYDGKPPYKSYGDVLTEVKPSYAIGDVVSAIFQGANPRNNLHLEQTYAAVEKLDPWTGRWMRVRDDSDWGLIFNWRKVSGILGTSEVEIKWETEDWVEAGQYRVKYYGDSKAVGGTITAFEGVSGEFVLT